jgi:hypothetical protein
MANDEHVALLKQGVAAWNAWRRENPDVRPNLSEVYLWGADLSGADLSGADLSGANLTHANLNRANLNGAILEKAVLEYVDLMEANLSGADLSRAWLFVQLGVSPHSSPLRTYSRCIGVLHLEPIRRAASRVAS